MMPAIRAVVLGRAKSAPPITQAKWTYNAAPLVQSFVFADPNTTDFLGEVFLSGTAIVTVPFAGRTVTAVSVGGVAATKINESLDSATAGVQIWALPGVSAGIKTVTVTNTGTAAWKVCVATGTLSASINATPTATPVLPFAFGADPQVTPTFTLPANGVAVAVCGVSGNGVTPIWGIGTANSERHGANGEFQFGTASLLGGASSSSTHFEVSGFAFSGSEMAVVVFGP